MCVYEHVLVTHALLVNSAAAVCLCQLSSLQNFTVMNELTLNVFTIWIEESKRHIHTQRKGKRERKRTNRQRQKRQKKKKEQTVKKRREEGIMKWQEKQKQKQKPKH